MTLSTSSAYEYDTQYGKRGGIFSGSLTPDFLTFTNFEVLDMYLSQEYMQFKGKTRSIYLTEGGISSSGYYGDGQGRDGDEMGNKMQAGYIAALWYKISQIDSVKCFNYYRLIDNWGDGGEGTKYGLLTSQHEKKPAYTVWKYIDTQYSLIVSQPYLQYIKFYDKNGNMKTFENGDITSYLDIVDICGTGYFNGKEFDWTKAMPVTAPIVEEWEIA